MSFKVWTLAGVTVITLSAISIWTPGPSSGSAPAPKNASVEPSREQVERARKTIRMLDDIYKTAVVLITEHYVHDEDDLSAGSAAAALFAAIEEKGWHSARLVDATGQPYDEANVARDDFEKEAIRRLNAGEAYYDLVGERDGKPVLRAMTAIPVVMEKCTMCHAHYKNAAEGQAIGGISYILPID